jgi:hypothetical protein
MDDQKVAHGQRASGGHQRTAGIGSRASPLFEAARLIRMSDEGNTVPRHEQWL